MKNSTIYNGKQSEYTKAAESMLDLAMAEFSRHEEKLRSLEEKINPAANKSTQVSLLVHFNVSWYYVCSCVHHCSLTWVLSAHVLIGEHSSLNLSLSERVF